jgi:hypothetical protein
MTTVAPRDLILDSRYQPRVTIDTGLVQEYAELMSSGWGTFPAVEVFRIGKELYVVDGFHRVKAALLANVGTIPANIRQGTPDDALLFCVRANSTHGLRRSNQDKRRAVEMLLDHPIFSRMGSKKIAEYAGVSSPMVIDIKRQRAGEMTTTEKRRAGGVESTHKPAAVPSKLPQAVQAFADVMREAGASKEVIASAVALLMSERAKKAQQRATRPKVTNEERLKTLLERIGRERQKVAVVTLEEATPRTKSYAKLPRRW